MPIAKKTQSKNTILQIVTSQVGVERNTMPIRVEPHEHMFYEIVLVVKGPLTHHIQTKNEASEQVLNAGDLFAIAPHEIHWYDYNPGADVAFYNIYLSPSPSRKFSSACTTIAASTRRPCRTPFTGMPTVSRRCT